MSLRVPFPFPLRDDFMAVLELPDDLTAEESERVRQYVSTLATTDHIGLSSGIPENPPQGQLDS